MSPSEFQKYLHEHIPLSRAMEIQVREISPESVVLGAPLLPNINQHHTLFGGSASTLAILAGWSLVYTRLLGTGSEADIVIQRNTMNYDTPIAGDVIARAALPDEATWSRFLRMLQRRGRARIEVVAILEYEGNVAGRFTGEFVALAMDNA